MFWVFFIRFFSHLHTPNPNYFQISKQRFLWKWFVETFPLPSTLWQWKWKVYIKQQLNISISRFPSNYFHGNRNGFSFNINNLGNHFQISKVYLTIVRGYLKIPPYIYRIFTAMFPINFQEVCRHG